MPYDVLLRSRRSHGTPSDPRESLANSCPRDRLSLLFFAVAATLFLTVGPGQAWAQGSIFAQTHAWIGAAEDTQSVALGDVDGDGDLDLVLGRVNRGAALHLNTGGKFASDPAWTGPAENTYSVALGDIDADGDLDLVRGNYKQRVTLYLNSGGIFASDAAWTGPAENTYSVALGDVDADGDIDLVRGNWSEGATLYLNIGGVFDSTAAWTGPIEMTSSVALGDVDGDGDLDLVRGNYFSTSPHFRGASLYLNNGGVFASDPAWSGPEEGTYSVALGDVDGDGDLDLVRGNWFHGATLYVNTGGVFASSPAWTGPSDGLSGYGRSIALGDVDADGDLDLVLGNQYRVGATLHLNTGGTFDSVAAWTGPAEYTFAMALGDVDGDDDLDLIRGNMNRGATLYLNTDAHFNWSRAWTGPDEFTKSVVLGDVDGDGDLDLIRGNLARVGPDHNWGTTLYLNGGGIFAATPAWTGVPAQDADHVALGDVDGDADLDLVCGGGLTRLFVNNAGAFGSAPAWLGEGSFYLALGDVDRDGDLDLVRGVPHSRILLHLNIDGVFSSDPWPGAAEHTYSVALGDIDRDGDVDLVRGNWDQGATVCLNVGGIFDSVAAWTGRPGNAHGVALGDVDGEGHLDLVCANADGVTLYLNAGGTLGAAPTWSVAGNTSRSVVLGDVDSDGDLDLVRGNIREPGTFDPSDPLGAALYLNAGGALDVTPAWTGPAEFTYSLALGDVDGDGGLDLVHGNYREGDPEVNDPPDPGSGSAVLYLRPRAWHAGPAPVRNLPNNPAHLRWVRVARAGINRYRIVYQAVDAESDLLWIVGEYQLEGTRTWNPMALDRSSLRAGPFSTSPAGVEHEVEWDVSRLPFDRRNVVIRLRAVSPPRRTGLIQFVPSYLVTVGLVTPARPEVKAQPNSLQFPTQTVGDIRVATLEISNGGTLDLMADRIESPDSSLVVSGATSFTLSPGGTHTVDVILAPRRPLESLGPIRVYTNDPVTPTLDIPLTTDIRALKAESRLLTGAPELPLGEAATVMVTPAESVHVERGFVFYRSSAGATSAYDSTSLGPLGDQFVGLVPGEAVTEGGLDYYVRVENNGVLALAPPGSPDEPASYPVASPQHVASQVREGIPGGHPVGEPAQVIVTVPQGTQAIQARVLFRAGGAAAYDSSDAVPFAPGASSAEVLIPGGAVGPRGFEYRVRVQTLTRTLSDPADSLSPPRMVRTDVPSLTEAIRHDGGHYRLLSVPLELNLPVASSLEALLSDDLGSYDPTRWRSFRYVPEDAGYLEISPSAVEGGKLRPEPGRGFWLVAKDAYRLDTDPIAGRSVPSDVPCRVTLTDGWNQIGDPFLFPVAWQDVAVEGLPPGGMLEPPVAWDEALASYRNTDVDTLRPFEGYWVKNSGSGTVSLLIPPREAVGGGVAHPALGVTDRAPDSTEWQLQIVASSGSARDTRNFAGVASTAREGADAVDRSDPPPAPGEALTLYFVAEDEPGHNRTVDLRPPVTNTGDPRARGHRWVFDVARKGSDVSAAEAQLTFVGVERVPAEIELRLVDRALRRVIDARSEADIGFVSTLQAPVTRLADARFELLAGTLEYVEAMLAGGAQAPLQTRLLPSFPNPTRSSTTVRFELARAGPVRLEVYDVAGRRLRELLRGNLAAGIHELAWDGRDDLGRDLAPGIYTLRMMAADHGDRRKVVKLP